MTANEVLLIRIARLVDDPTREKFAYLCDTNHTLDCRHAIWQSLTERERTIFAVMAYLS